MKNFIEVFDNALRPDECKSIIDFMNQDGMLNPGCITTKEGKEMKEEMDSKPYANRVGSLLWLARTYRFDIPWVVGMRSGAGRSI